MNIFHGLLFGIVEGLTEFLPISSTAHLILAGEWLQLPSTEFLKTFEISIQLGAILAVVILYWKKIWSSWNLIGKLAIAFIPTGLIGFGLYKIVKKYLLDNNYIIAATLFIGGIILIMFEKYLQKKNNFQPTNSQNDPDSTNGFAAISYKQAAAIGLFQSLAIIPGTSRSAATIIGGLSLGIKREIIVEFSFLLAIPTMAAATGYDLYKNQLFFNGNELIIWLIGFIASFITAIISIKFFIKFIKKNNFIYFGWYRIILSLIVLTWLFVQH